MLLSEEYYFRFIEPDKTKLNEITFIISLDKVIGDTIYAYANAEELKNLQQLRYSIEILSHTGSLYKVEIRSSLRDLHNWDSYPTYEAYLQMMQQFETNYPEICRLDTFGYSVEGGGFY